LVAPGNRAACRRRKPGFLAGLRPLGLLRVGRGSLVGFYGREGLAAEVGASPEGSGFSGLVLTYVVRSEARVDEIIAEAKKAGATILKPPATKQWGGYGGSFADPDGYIWDIGYSAQGKN
jgi:catechol 2,3-dioxygenase-like lactoylglutathione lyase family enzyme